METSETVGVVTSDRIAQRQVRHISAPRRPGTRQPFDRPGNGQDAHRSTTVVFLARDAAQLGGRELGADQQRAGHGRAPEKPTLTELLRPPPGRVRIATLKDIFGRWYQTVRVWRERFAEHRLDGLDDEPRCGAPRKIDDDRVEAIVVKTLETIRRSVKQCLVPTSFQLSRLSGS